MCDTLVILGKFTKNGKTIFGKNSDRDPDEAQNIIFLRGGKHSTDESVECTYINVPQVENTYDVILSQPSWMWGGEIGVNQFGVVIGNEAVFTNEKLEDKGLLGMDMIRLALERTKSAEEALDCIISLLEIYGQGGGCGYHDRSFNYHNSWIIADPIKAFVLESAGIHWVWKKIEKNYSISNLLTIGNEYDGISKDAITNAIKKGKCKSKEQFSFAGCYSAKGLNMKSAYRILSRSKSRREFHNAQTCNIIDNENASVPGVMEILRSHQRSKVKHTYDPKNGSNHDICDHASWGIIRQSQSTNSIVAELSSDLSSIWTTCSSAPCIQVYKPLFLFDNSENSIPQSIKSGGELYDESSIWWRNELLHRLVLKNYKGRTKLYFPERDAFEQKCFRMVSDITNNNQPKSPELSTKLQKLSISIFNEEKILISKWIDLIKSDPINNKTSKFYHKFWNITNKNNQINI